MQALSNLAQDFVAHVMTVGIVDVLEMVEIKNSHADRLFDLAKGIEIFGQGVIKITPVVHAGEPAGHRGMLERLRTDRQRFGHFLQISALPQATRHDREKEQQTADHREDRQHGAHEGEFRRRVGPADHGAIGYR